MIQRVEFFKDAPAVSAAFSTRDKEAENVREAFMDSGLLVVRPVQVHKDNVETVTEEMVRACRESGSRELVLPDTDAVITACGGTALTTVHADCLPVWLYDEPSGAIGVAHAGWRGTCAGIGVKMARAMTERLGASAASMRAAVGPGISLCCFEVGPEVYEAFAEQWDFIDECARRKPDGKYLLDLKEINRRQLTAFGIRSIEVSPLCTFCAADEESGEPIFYSYRRDGGMAGRMTASIYLK